MENVPTKPPSDSLIWETIRNSLGDSQNSKLADPEYRAKKITTLAMTQAAFWGAFPGISWAAIAVICTAEVALIGESYGYAWDRQKSKEFVYQLLKGMGLATGGLLAGGKIINDLLKVSGVATLAGIAADAVLCGAVAYAVGETTTDYFKKGCRIDKDTLKNRFKETLRQGKNAAAKVA